MKGEHVEYCVQCFDGGLWICKAPNEDLGYVEQVMAHLKKIHPGDKFRYAIRIVSDWCEMKAKEDRRGMNAAEQDKRGRK